MTSNVGADLLKKQTVMGSARRWKDNDYDSMRDKILDETKRVFKPSFSTDWTRPLSFIRSASRSYCALVDLEVDKVLARIKAKEVHIELKQSAKEFLIEKGYDPQYGARPMRRAVERFLEDPLAEELLRGNVKPGDRVEVVDVDGKLSFQVPESQQSSAAASAS